MISICALLAQAQHKLGRNNPDAQLEAELLLCHLLHKNRAYLYAHPEQILEQTLIATYMHFITERAQGVPIAYLTGMREFWSLPLKVTPHTLIPRPETEILVELALELIPNNSDTKILDLGTGGGAIALAIAKERPNWQVFACDLSLDALEVAKENAHNLKITNVFFYHSDWFEALPSIKYQAIVANPPYIAAHDSHLKQGDLRFEPLSALASGENGLADIDYIIKQSVKYLIPGGLLLLEHGWDQKISISAILKQLAYKNVRSWQDLLGHDRVSGGWLTQ